MIYSTTYPSPVGVLTLACRNEQLVGLWMEGQKYFGDTLPEPMIASDTPTVFRTAKTWLEQYFSGKKPSISGLPLAPIGTVFRRDIWALLCEIPYGETTTYGELAKKMARKTGKMKMSAQAVGGAVGHNPVSIIIPCHRVVGADGSLTGYAGGCQTKIKLLELEGVETSRLFIPRKGTAL